jgi:hypothetical protein
MWFTDTYNDEIGKVEPATGRIVEYSATPALDMPTGIAAGPDGAIWFTDAGNGAIGRLQPSTLEITEFTTATPALDMPTAIVAGPDGNMWFINQFYSEIGKIVPGPPVRPGPGGGGPGAGGPGGEGAGGSGAGGAGPGRGLGEPGSGQGATTKGRPPAARRRIKLVLCGRRPIEAGRRTRRRCSTRSLNGRVSLAATGVARALLLRHGVIYASGTANPGRLVLSARAGRTLRPGRYTLQLIYRRGRRSVLSRQPIAIA